MPTSVSTDSGWNCTPSTRSLRWRRPMMRPSVSAEISSSRGRLFFSHDQRVVARGHEVLRQLAKDRLVVVMDAAGLAVHEVRGANDLAAEGVADGLMTQADAQKRNLAGEAPDDVDADAGILGHARAGRDDDALGFLAAISSRVIWSLRRTSSFSPNWPRNCARL